MASIASIAHWVIPALWLVWLGYWGYAAIGAKPVREAESFGSRLSYIVPLILGAVLLSSQNFGGAWLTTRFVPYSLTVLWIAILLLAAGLAFSVLARGQLGSNWSGTVTIKEQHELICSGVYGWVRHPIYTGLLLAVFGTALATGEIRGLIAARCSWRRFCVRWQSRSVR